MYITFHVSFKYEAVPITKIRGDKDQDPVALQEVCHVVLTSPNCSPLDIDEWIISIMNELNTLGLMYIFEGNSVHENNVFFIIKSRFNDVYQQNMLSRIQNTTRGALYKHLLDDFTIQFCLQKSLNPTYRKYLSKFRLSAHSLNIEKGRYNNTNRTVQTLKMNSILF